MTDQGPMPPALSSVWATMTSPGPTCPTEAPICLTSLLLSNREHHLCAHTAVDQERGAGDIRCLVREQIRHAVRDVDRLTDLAKRHFGVDRLAHLCLFCFGGRRPHEGRVDGTWRHRVDADAA